MSRVKCLARSLSVIFMQPLLHESQLNVFGV